MNQDSVPNSLVPEPRHDIVPLNSRTDSIIRDTLWNWALSGSIEGVRSRIYHRTGIWENVRQRLRVYIGKKQTCFLSVVWIQVERKLHSICENICNILIFLKVCFCPFLLYILFLRGSHLNPLPKLSPISRISQ